MTTPELVELVFDQGGLLWIDVNWRTLRTSHATWVVQAGADPKSVQGQMRRSRISTTMEIYAQIVPLAQRRALEQLSAFAAPRSNSRSITSKTKAFLGLRKWLQLSPTY
jgi:site-specific recombinase XerD